MSESKHLLRGAVAGLAGGLIASWVMNAFIAGPGKSLQHAVQSDEENRQQEQQSGEPQEDATMKTADTVTSIVTGGRHLTWEEKEKGGPVVHYAFGGAMGAVYGALAEYCAPVRSGFGTSFGSVLFTGADLIAVPVLNLGPKPTEQPASSLASPYAAHLVYGVTTEFVRRIVRRVL